MSKKDNHFRHGSAPMDIHSPDPPSSSHPSSFPLPLSSSSPPVTPLSSSPPVVLLFSFARGSPTPTLLFSTADVASPGSIASTPTEIYLFPSSAPPTPPLGWWLPLPSHHRRGVQDREGAESQDLARTGGGDDGRAGGASLAARNTEQIDGMGCGLPCDARHGADGEASAGSAYQRPRGFGCEWGRRVEREREREILKVFWYFLIGCRARF